MTSRPRPPLNVAGDFYVSGTLYKNGDWCSDCLDCALPEAEAPDLLAPMDDDFEYTHFIKQPETEEEIERAISACGICCTSALRYGGKDRKILKRLGEEYCDYRILINGKIASTLTGEVVE